MLKFKKGAFVSEKRVTPVVMRYSVDGSCSPDWGTCDLVPLVIMNLSYVCCLSCEVVIMDDFEPTEFMYKKFSNVGEERWEVYAWALREAMAKYG